ncbi:uncharacterized protein B0H18DRAFT_1130470 [Fomitopsis serialis]|uniref:uncharacterized protein n=1 Tax=Fomitopsis serialis TaxID=139415 RepID=UPI002007C23A|nr:uncharacterized protein B0H18DRAFT_1130470 [Neoantrodia serialis]KAH9910260.1 hypothetical protein B0H18DRAFT_1130470 [Neoantrodia serialis]
MRLKIAGPHGPPTGTQLASLLSDALRDVQLSHIPNPSTLDIRAADARMSFSHIGADGGGQPVLIPVHYAAARPVTSSATLASSPAHPLIRELRLQGRPDRDNPDEDSPDRFARFQHLAQCILSTNGLIRSPVNILPLLPRLHRTVSYADLAFCVDFLLLIPRTPRHTDVQHWDKAYDPKYETLTKTKSQT